MNRLPAFRILLIGLGVFAALVFINILVLDLLIFFGKSQPPALRTIVLKQDQPATTSQDFGSKNSCPSNCIKKIEEATASVKLTQTPSPKPTAISTPTPAQTQTTTPSSSGVKEYFIPVGAGSLSSGDWTDLAGAQTTIDSNQYANIKSVVFEVSLRIPTGNETAYARLFNVTDKHPVWYSDVSIDGGTPKLVFSQPITLEQGVRTYQVQMKTSLLYPAYIDQSRIHITIY
ncbi:MAG: hypothetical protein M1372_01125 [Patescibacteria group bacterium]|nr:hypothetical protein [Patescibacteria group bacterium]